MSRWINRADSSRLVQGHGSAMGQHSSRVPRCSDDSDSYCPVQIRAGPPGKELVL